MTNHSGLFKNLAWITTLSLLLSSYSMFGSLSPVSADAAPTGSTQVSTVKAPVKIMQSQQWSDKSGNVQLIKGIGPDGDAIGKIVAEDWIKYAAIDFGAGVYDTFMATLAASPSEAGRKIEIRLDSQTGEIIGNLIVQSTGSLELFKEQYASIANVTGVHDLYFSFPDGSVGNWNWFAFGQTPDNETKEQHDQRMQWFNDARFGQFIHWGAYSQLAGTYNDKTYDGASEWIMANMNIPKDDYIKQAVTPFNPTQYDAKEWVDVMRKAGQKYMVITSKHHDGFSMYDTKVTDHDNYNIVKSTPYEKDPMVELSKEAKKQGIKFGFYYSILEWNNPKVPAQKEQYVSEMKEQLRELIENYDPDLLWFDGDWDAWWTQQDGEDLYRYLRTLKNDLVINNRVGKRLPGDGDYGTPEQEIPSTGMKTIWETCMTMNGSWGFHAKDFNWKSTQTLISNLIETSSKGGNYLLNVGPSPEGLIPQASVERLTEMGDWLKIYGESIYDTKASIFVDHFSWGYSTTKNGKVYLHVLNQPTDNKITLPKLINKVNKVSSLADSSEILNYTLGEEMVISLPASHPNPYASVYVIDVNGQPKVDMPENLAAGKPATASNVYENSASYDASKAVDDDYSTRWATDDSNNPQMLEVDFGQDTTFNKVLIDEWVHNNVLRISEFKIQYWNGTEWKDAYSGTTAGPKKAVTFEAVTGSKIRLNILSVSGWSGPTINEFQVYHTDVKVSGITVDKQQLNLSVGQSGQLQSTVIPNHALNKNVIWSSSDDKVASIEDKGNGISIIHGLKTGTAVITVTTADGMFTATTNVTVAESNNDEMTTVLTAPSSTLAGRPFTVQIDLNHVNKKMFGQDITLDYDASVMKFVSAKSIKAGSNLLETTKDHEGKLRLIVASEGADHGISGNASLIELTFKAKDVKVTKSGTISITSATLGDELGTETNATPSAIQIEIRAVPTGTPGDMNNDGKVSIGDLAIVAANYGKTKDSADWNQIKSADVNGDGIIDLIDLATVAKAIVK